MRTTNEQEHNPEGILGLPWNRVIVYLIVWLGLFALGGLFVQNPAWIEPSAAVEPILSNAMYFHGLLVGLAALVCLVAAQALGVYEERQPLASLGAAREASLRERRPDRRRASLRLDTRTTQTGGHAGTRSGREADSFSSI